MKPVLPSGDDMAAFAARRQRREQEEKARRSTVQNRFRVILLVFAALLLVALVADLRHVSRRIGARVRGQDVPRQGDAADIAAGLDGPRYVDPAGLFSFVPPRNWVKAANPADGFYNAVFQGPYGMSLSIQVVATPGETFVDLIEKLRKIERNLSADTHMDFAYVGPHRAVKRSVQLFKTKLLMLDFVTGDLAHHVQFSVPPELYDEYEPVFLRLMQTYEPGQLLPAPASPAVPELPAAP